MMTGRDQDRYQGKRLFCRERFRCKVPHHFPDGLLAEPARGVGAEEYLVASAMDQQLRAGAPSDLQGLVDGFLLRVEDGDEPVAALALDCPFVPMTDDV